jgi:hypothetical protein
MTKFFCNQCGVEVVPNGSDVLVIGKLIEPQTDLKTGTKRIKEVEFHLCSKCSKKTLKDILNAKSEITKT